ncbi:thioredoxin domain-containing protein [Paracoccus sp. (in: a-proteobacteria)]|mgnify:FL=1|uniref:DsbA family protein n=1 Tax=Paracoccus sp. TaxID=267 RepID=UPI0028A1CD22|nr:thioredoxin domain-containing protein [Paracoccus sp. (in: a-proteobacteria)]
MNRRTLILGSLAAGLAVYAGGTWYVQDQRRKEALAEAARRAAEVPDLNSVLLRPGAASFGAEDAPVTLVEFFDPSCEACRAFHPVLTQLRTEFPDQLRIVMRYAAFHQGSDEAVAILEAARRQNLFEPVLNALLESQPNWALHDGPRMEIAWQIAEAQGLDISARDVELRSPGTVAILNRDRADIEVLGVRATPTFYLNGAPLGQVSFESLSAAVRAAVQASAAGQ